MTPHTPDTAPPLDPAQYRCIGRSGGPVGLHGHLKASFHQADAAAWLPAIKQLWLVSGKAPNQTTTPLTIDKWQHQIDTQWRIRIAGLSSRTALEKANIGKGELWASTNDLPSLADDEFYLDDLIGLQVFLDSTDASNTDNNPLGSIVAWSESAGQTFVEIAPTGKAPTTANTVMVPFNQTFFPALDLEARTVTLHGPLLDLF